MHLMVQRLGLVEDIDRHLHLLKVHCPNPRVITVLNWATTCAGGQCLDGYRTAAQGTEVFLNGLGAQTDPHPTTEGDFHAAAFAVGDIVTFCRRVSKPGARGGLEGAAPGFLERRRLSMWMGRFAEIYGECKAGRTSPIKGSGLCAPDREPGQHQGKCSIWPTARATRPATGGRWRGIDRAIAL